MSSYIGIKKLNAEEAALVDEIKDNSLFSGYGSECALESCLEEKRKEKEAARVEPYADLLYQHIKSRCESNRAALWTQLKGEGQCDVYDYLVLFYNQTLLEKKRALAERSHEEQEPHDPPSHAFDTTLGVKKWSEYDGEWYDVADLYAIKIHRIFSNSDLLQRIALLFGPKFKAERKFSTVEEEEGQWGWKHTLVSIRVKYVGDKMGSYEVDAMLKTYAKHKAREPFTLGKDQWLYGDAFPERPLPKPVPAPLPPPVRTPNEGGVNFGRFDGPVSLLGSSSVWAYDGAHVPAHLSGTGKEEKVVAMRF